MSKEMDNHSFNERNSLTGNSGMLALSSVKPKLQPIRIKEFLDMYGSDEEDSEDKGKDSNSDSDNDDIQPLPEDPEEKWEDRLTTVVEESSTVSTRRSVQENIALAGSEPEIQSEQLRRCSSEVAAARSKENVDRSLSRSFGNNFSIAEHRPMKSGLDEIPTQPRSVGSAPEPESRRSNSKFQDTGAPIGEPSVPIKIESTSYSKTAREIFPSELQFRTREVARSLQERASSGVTHLEPVPSLSSSLRTPSSPPQHLVTDTPMKNNQAIGATRPTPSTSHRNIFQTPQGSKARPDCPSLYHAQTPATIFGNWSKNHMSQTPSQNRSTTVDSIPRSQPLSAPQQPPPSHDLPSHRDNEEKRVRRPLAETVPPAQSNQHCQNDKFASQYLQDAWPSSKTYENPGRAVLERKNDSVPAKSTLHISKENRHPGIAEKLSHGEEEPLPSRGKVSESARTRAEDIPNENPPKESVRDVILFEQHPPSFRGDNPMPAAPAQLPEKKNPPERQNNIQVSIPSRVRRHNQGQTIIVKGKEYLILGTLGEGMSGHVLRVQELTSLDLRAIKVVDLSRMDKDCAQGCLQEISMLHKLQAPCIVKMFDHEIKYPMVNVVLEMGDTDFKSLLNSMSEKNRLPLTMILYYWTEMLTAVKHIHDNGVIHSDLKPANFLLVRGRLKLIDFGIASSMNADMTSVVKNNPIGTLNYISPEALMDIGGSGSDSPNRTVKYKISFKSDVWSLGCILYSLVYGYTPFHNIRTQWAKVSAITNPHPKISFAPPTGNDIEPTPPILIDVMRKCLQHDPKARPTVAQLLQIPYIPINKIAPKPAPDIPSNILMKIKYSLSDSEWRQFTEIMEARRCQF